MKEDVITDNCNKVDTELVEKSSAENVANQTKVSNQNGALSPNVMDKMSVAIDSMKCDSTDNNQNGNLRNNSMSKKKIPECKNTDHLMKEMSKFGSSDEKIQFIVDKYNNLFIEHDKTQNLLKSSEKKIINMQKEKENLQADYNKSVLARSKLEDLCRELQRQNKLVEEESIARVKEEEEKRKEASNKFQAALNDITAMLQDNKTQSSKLQEDNVEMSKKLKMLFEQYQLREKQIEKLKQHHDIEKSISETTVANMSAAISEEKENGMLEKKKLLEELMALQKKCTELATNELRARTELKVYQDKYEEFQENLKKSNSVFDNFKTEMNKMSKKIGKLKKETIEWQNKWKDSNKALITLAEDKQKSDTQLSQSLQKVIKLENLCRALQQERNDLLSIERSASCSASSGDSVDGKVKNEDGEVAASNQSND